MPVQLHAAATEEPISLAEAKLHLRVRHTHEDNLIARQVVAARRWVEKQTWRAIALATYRLTLDEWPETRTIWIPRPRLVSVTTVEFLSGESYSPLDSSEYEVDTASEPGRLRLKANRSWPVADDSLNAVRLTYTAGWAAADVPDDLKAAMLLVVGHLYQNREEVITGTIATTMPRGFDALVSNHEIRDQRLKPFVLVQEDC